MINIYATATSFGFGPSSILIILLKEISKLNLPMGITVLGYENIKEFYSDYHFVNIKINPVDLSKKREKIDSFVTDMTNVQSVVFELGKLLKKQSTGKNILISVLDPDFGLVALKTKMKLIYVDFFPWLWNYSPKINRKLQHKLKLNIKKFTHISSDIELIRFLENTSEVEKEWLVHRLATVLWTPLFIEPVNTSKLLFVNKSSLLKTDSIINRCKTKSSKANNVLVMLGGVYNSKVYQNYVRGVLRNVSKIFSFRYPNKRVCVLVPPYYLDLAYKLCSRYPSLEIRSCSNKEKLNLLAEAEIVLCPPGLNSIAEVVYANKKLVLLPTWNHSHFHILRELSKNNKLSGVTWEQLNKREPHTDEEIISNFKTLTLKSKCVKNLMVKSIQKSNYDSQDELKKCLNNPIKSTKLRNIILKQIS